MSARRSRSNGATPPSLLAVTGDEMRAIDRLTIDRYGVPGAVLMERAGSGAVDVLVERFATALRSGVVLVAGKGNNGGDALVMARLLRKRRVRATVFLAAERSALRGDAAANLRRLERGGQRVYELHRAGLVALADAASAAGVVVDGLYGTGLRGELDGRSLAIIDTINAAPCPILAVDVPSGLDADRGRPLGGAVEATVTATFAFPKVGLLIEPGASYAGEVAVVDIGVAPEAVAAVSPRQHLITAETVASALPPRFPDSHKGTYGHALVIAGARGKTGAGLLSGRAALRAGAGLVTLASPSPDLGAAAIYCPELMTEALPQSDGAIDFSRRGEAAIGRLLAGKDAVVYGPGIGLSAASRRLARWLIGASAAPLVIDADGLNAVAGHLEWLRGRKADVVLTPHPGEMARLIDGSTADVQRDRVACARSFAVASKVTVVLKGARTLVASPDGRVGINPTGNPGMASGGMGDALAGIIGAALAQGLEAREAAEAAVFWHGHAGDRVAARSGAAGILASDVVDELPSALAALQDRLFGADHRADRR